MRTLEEFEQHLRKALMHLYDPAYQPPDQLWVIMDCDPQQGVATLQATIVQAIKNLEPEPEIPSSARIRRLYELLSYRFIQGLTQEETAEVLNLSLRHIRREQQQAVGILARRLWEQKQDETLFAPSRPAETRETEVVSTAWRSQVRQELAALQKSAPGSIAHVKEALSSLTKLAGPLISEHNVDLTIEPVPPDLSVTLHPSVLNQLLITAIEKLAQQMSSGQITLRAEQEGKHIRIVITGHPVTAKELPKSDLIQEILTKLGGTIEIHTEGKTVAFELWLPSADEIKVLVVDDNADLVHFYRRYTAGTRYQITHVSEGQRVFETIEASPPDLIVLDVMLPDMDGWELLTRLREYPPTQSTPVVVCSVVRREKLALTLGATVYVPKPVGYQQFVQALDQALTQVAA